MGADPKAYFGAIPFRAFADRRLGDLDVRVLGVIATHDSMSQFRDGQGCWAGTDRIAYLASANANNVSSSITKLEHLGYLRRGPHPHDRRRSSFVVVYEKDADKAAFKRESVSPSGEISPESVSPSLPKVSRPPSSINGGTQPDQHPNRTYNRTSNRTSLNGRRSSVGADLAILERAIKEGKLIDREAWSKWLCAFTIHADINDPNTHIAQRLYEKIEGEIHDNE